MASQTMNDSQQPKRRSVPPADRSASFEAKRREIAEAAVKVFDRVGFQRATMAALADEMGVDRSSLYYYITSKEELLDEVLRTVVERNFMLAEKIRRSNVSPRRKLRDFIIMLMTSYGEHYPLFYIYIRENLSHVSGPRSEWSAKMREMNRQTTDSLVAIIEEGFADGSFRPIGKAHVIAYGIFGVVGWTSRWFKPDRSDTSAQEIGATYAEMVLCGLESPY